MTLNKAIANRGASGLVLVLALSAAAGAAAFDGTLLGTVALTVEQQSSIASGRQAIVAGEGQLLVAKSAFETNVNASVSQGRTLTPFPSVPGYPPYTIDSHLTMFQTGVTQRLRSGIIVNPAISVTRTRDNSANVSEPGVGTVAVNFTVPLLKGSGTRVNTAAEVAAQLGVDAATEGYRDALTNAIVRSVSAYWDYLAAVRILDIARAAEVRAGAMLEDARKLARGDEIPKSDVLKYESNLVRDSASRVAAEQAQDEARAALSLAIGLPGGSATPIGPPRDDFPSAGEAGLGLLADAPRLDALSQLALRRRPDLLASEHRLLAAETLFAAATADDKPRLDLTASLGYNAMAEGRSAIGAWSALNQNTRGPNVFFGLAYALPVSNYENTGVIRQRAAAAEQARLERDSIAKTIRTNLKLRLDNVSASSRQLEQTRAARKIDAQVFENEQKRYRLGVSTVLDLLSSESQLTASQVNEVNAQRNFAQALLRYRAETSTLLDHARESQSLDRSRLTSLPDRFSLTEQQ